MRIPRLAQALLLPLLLAACFAGDPAEVGDDQQQEAPITSAQRGCLVNATADEARGVLAYVNDPSVTAAELDAAGLSASAASAMVAARPLADLKAVDAVSGVGTAACNALHARACDVRGLCEPELSVWTWNIEHFPLTGAAVTDVATTLQQMKAELVGFEEVDSLPAFGQLLSELPGWQGIPGKEGFKTQVAVAYRTDRLKVVATQDLFTHDPSRFPRPVLAVTFDVRGKLGASRVTFVVVHLKAMIDAASKQRRREAVIALEQWMSAQRAAGEAVIAVGDWNDDIDVPAAQNVFEPFLTHPDAYTALTLPVAEAGGYSYVPFQRLIDHQFQTHEAALRFPALAVEPLPLETTIPSYVTTVSDHRPVRSRLVPIIPAK